MTPEQIQALEITAKVAEFAAIRDEIIAALNNTSRNIEASQKEMAATQREMAAIRDDFVSELNRLQWERIEAQS